MTDSDKVFRALLLASDILDSFTDNTPRHKTIRNVARCFISVLEPDEEVEFEEVEEIKNNVDN